MINGLYVTEPGDLGSVVTHIIAVIGNTTIDGSRDVDRTRESIERVAGVRVQLIVHRDAFDDSFHIAALLPLKNGSVVSISPSSSGLPWPLRGVQRWSDQDLLRVNGRTLSVRQAIAFLDFLWKDRGLIIRLIDSCLMEDALADHPIPLSTEDVQGALDEWRRAQGLTSREAMQEWLATRGFSLARFGRYVADELRIQRLRHAIAESLDHEVTRKPVQVRDVVALVIEGVIPAAEHTVGTYLRSGADPKLEDVQALISDGSIHAMRIVHVGEGNCTPQVVDRVKRARVGDVVGPVYANGTATFVRVLASLERSAESVADRIIEERLSEWLREKRRSARIEWNWGPGEQVANLESDISQVA